MQKIKKLIFNKEDFKKNVFDLMQQKKTLVLLNNNCKLTSFFSTGTPRHMSIIALRTLPFFDVAVKKVTYVIQGISFINTIFFDSVFL